MRAGSFHRLWQAALTEYDEIKGLDWSWLSADGCQTKAPLAVEKSGPNPTDRAKQGTKRSLLVEAAGVCANWRNCCQLAAVLTELASREIQEFGQKEPGMIQPTAPESEEERATEDDSSGFIPPPFAWN